MTDWNIPKIREEGLKLMGWKHDPTLGLWGGPFVNWRDPSGKHVLESGIPEPTASLDDALPLAHKYEIGIDFSGSGMATVTNRFGTVFEFRASSVALAVCLCALRCAGHNLDDFKVKP